MTIDATVHKSVIRYLSALNFLDRMPGCIIGILSRIGIAAIFWRSGRTKVHDVFSINDSTYFLFAEEYKVPLLPPEFATVMATVSEHIFPILLVIGFASRLSAAALLGMTAVIQIFVYPSSWPDHTLWAAALVYIIIRGPGTLSIDAWIKRKYT